jgi:hypothetical protein
MNSKLFPFIFKEIFSFSFISIVRIFKTIGYIVQIEFCYGKIFSLIKLDNNDDFPLDVIPIGVIMGKEISSISVSIPDSLNKIRSFSLRSNHSLA